MWSTFKRKFIGDRNFYRKVIYIVIPMIVQNAITSFVNFLDNIMVGQIGTEQMTGVAIVNQLIFVFNLCIFGAVSGAGIFGTQYYGKGDYEGQKYAFRYKLYSGILIIALALYLFTSWDTTLISLYLNDTGNVGDIAKTLEYGKQYLAIMIFGLPAFAISQIYINSIRETGKTVIPMISGAVAVAVNLVLDYSLIFGIGFFPELGVRGAALATVAARFVECAIILVWTHTHKAENPYIVGAYKGFGMPKKVFKDIFIKGTPLMLNEVLWACGTTTLVQCYAVRGLEVVAAQNISSTITNLFNIVYMQIGASIAIVVGQLLGAGKLEEAKDADNKMIFFCVSACAVIACFMIAFGSLFPALYNTEPEIRALATQFIRIAALFMPFCAFCHATYFTLRSGGKTVITFIFDSVYVWTVMVPVAYFTAHHSNLPITSVFFCVQATEVVKVVIGFLMVRSGIWVQNIVKE
ncbi:MAG: MATE family efflux transporter [Lachnoclostridium sp.]|nr:MATE family efflux transporter [Lachnoclostridium sp.]